MRKLKFLINKLFFTPQLVVYSISNLSLDQKTFTFFYVKCFFLNVHFIYLHAVSTSFTLVFGIFIIYQSF